MSSIGLDLKLERDVALEVLPPDLMASTRGEWATDGEHFYFTLTEHESDIWVMELETGSE